MLDQEDLKWIATASTELNSMLQQISRYADLARHQNEANFIEALGDHVEHASRKAQAIFDKVTSSIMDARIRQPAREQFHSKSSLHPTIIPLPTALTSGAKTQPPAAQTVVKPAWPSDLKLRNPQGARELILLVDDEMEISDLAAEMLAEEGYRIILAKDGIEALKIYKQIGREIGLVILDFFLPVLDGDAVFEELQMINPEVNVVLSSGFAEQTKLGGMLARGLRGFIPKPYTREKLLAQVRMTLEAARQAIA
jgi:CheY-like chemotaxis protein